MCRRPICSAKRARAEDRAVRSRGRADRHRRSSDRHGACRLRGGARLCEGARRLRQADLRAPGGAVPPRRDGDADRGGAPARPPCRQPEGRRPAVPEGSGDGQAVRERDGRARLQRGDPDLRRLRLRQRFSGRAHLSRRARVPDLRRHVGRAEDPDRARARPDDRGDRDERRARDVTWLEAFETAQPPSPSWSDADRRWADRVALDGAPRRQRRPTPSSPARPGHAMQRLGTARAGAGALAGRRVSAGALDRSRSR